MKDTEDIATTSDKDREAWNCEKIFQKEKFHEETHLEADNEEQARFVQV
jgi:hypothetical protein